MKPWRRALVDFPRWLFCGTLVYAPWAYGCTEPIGIRGLNTLLALTLGSWLLVLLCRRRWPMIHVVLAASAAFLATFGWIAALNAGSLYDPLYNIFVLLPGRRAGWPSSVAGAFSWSWMCRGTFLLGSLLFVADLAQRPVWKLRLWVTMACTGASIALCGLIEKVSHAKTLLWGPFEPNATFFGTYYYHGNAGAFLNLVLPLVTGLTLRAIGRPDHSLQRSCWICALIVVLAGEAVNTSRAAQIIAVLLCLGLISWPARGWLLQSWRANRQVAAGFLALGIAGGIVLVASIGLSQPIAHWQDTSVTNGTGRLLAFGAGLRAIPDAGLSGFGAGAFRVVFPHYTSYLGDRIRGLWEYQHEDYIQTVLEWGVVGALVWSVALFGGLAIGWNRYRGYEAYWTRREKLLLITAVLSLLGISLHALVDFPLQIASLELYVMTLVGICWSTTFWPTAKLTAAAPVATLDRAPFERRKMVRVRRKKQE